MKTLIIDDEAEMAQTLARFLKRSGHDCVVAFDVAQALTSVAQHLPELVITDFCLPDGDGFDVIRHVLQTLPQTPVIVMTAYPALGQEQACRQAGAAAYLPKPFSLVVLFETIERILRTRLP